MRIATVLLAALVLMRPTLVGAQGAPSTAAEVGAISCRALEVHTDDGLKVTVVVFHQGTRNNARN